MAITFSTAYPPELKNSAWQKKKSFLDKAKSKTKTGLGDALTAAEKAWGTIDFNHLQASKQELMEGMRPYTLIQKNRARAQGMLNGPVAVTIEKLETAASVARKTGQNTGLSKDAVAAAKAISGKALATAKLLHDIKLSDFDTELQTATKDFEDLQEKYKEWITALEGSLDELAQKPTAANWKKAKMDDLIFKAYHFTITSVDNIGLAEYKGDRESWKQIDELFGRAKSRVETLKGTAQADVIRDFAETARPLLGRMY